MITVRQLGYLAGSFGKRKVRLEADDSTADTNHVMATKPFCSFVDCKYIAVFGAQKPCPGGAWIPLACSHHAPRAWMDRQTCSGRLCEIAGCGTRVKDGFKWCSTHAEMVAETQQQYPNETIEATLFRARARDKALDQQRSEAFRQCTDYYQLRDRIAHKLSSLRPDDSSFVPSLTPHSTVNTRVLSPHDDDMLALADLRLRDMGHAAAGNQSGSRGAGLLKAVQDLLQALTDKRDPREEAARMLSGGERARSRALELIASVRAKQS